MVNGIRGGITDFVTVDILQIFGWKFSMGANNLVCCLMGLRIIPNILHAFEQNPAKSMENIGNKQCNKSVLKLQQQKYRKL